MDSFDIVKFHFELPAEHAKLYEMAVWAQKTNYDYDVDYVKEPDGTMRATMCVVFDKKQYFNYKK